MDAKRPLLYRTVMEIAALWIAADMGYWIILPLFSVSINYNEAPVAIALYYAFWLLVSIITFRDTFLRHIDTRRFWIYATLSLGFSAIALLALYALSHLPIPSGRPLVLYTDILFASPWYFLPKSVGILVQQTLVAVLTLALAHQYLSPRHIAVAYGVIFGSAHVIVFMLSSTPTPYATIMTLGSLASAAILPHLILRVKNGFVYALHVAFYFFLAITLHIWPPPDYS